MDGTQELAVGVQELVLAIGAMAGFFFLLWLFLLRGNAAKVPLESTSGEPARGMGGADLRSGPAAAHPPLAPSTSPTGPPAVPLARSARSGAELRKADLESRGPLLSGDELATQFGDLLRAGELIKAVKLLRDQRGCTLKDAKDAADAVRAGGRLPDALLALPNTSPPAAGAASADDATLAAEVVAVAQRQGKLHAIKLYRERTGADLRTAKNAVEDLVAGAPAPGPAGTDPEVLSLVRAGQLIGAIKRYRELHGVSLKEAKDAIDALR